MSLKIKFLIIHLALQLHELFWLRIFLDGTAHKEQLKDECKKIIFKCIYAFFSSKTKNNVFNYRIWHTKTMNSLQNNINAVISEINPNYNGQFWTIGNSQKIINLMMKYFWVVSMRIKRINPEYKKNDFFKKYYKGIKAIERHLDIPVDRYIIYSIYNWNIQQILDCRYKNVKLPIDDKGEIKDWSKWDFNDYNNFSKSLHQYFESPIIWEGYAWTVGKLQCKSDNEQLYVNSFVDIVSEEQSKLSTICKINDFGGHEDLLKFLK